MKNTPLHTAWHYSAGPIFGMGCVDLVMMTVGVVSLEMPKKQTKTKAGAGMVVGLVDEVEGSAADVHPKPAPWHGHCPDRSQGPSQRHPPLFFSEKTGGRTVLAAETGWA